MKKTFALVALVLAVVSAQTPPAPSSAGKKGFVVPVMDKVPPVLPAKMKTPTVLIFSKTNGYRDDPAMKLARKALEDMVTRLGWGFYSTENAAVFNDKDLKRFKITLWNNTSGDTHDESQRAAFIKYMENGGAFFGVHGAGGDPEYAWKWYPQTLLKAQFRVHSSQQLGTIMVEDTKHPIMKGIPQVWPRTYRDEWYTFHENPRTKGVHVLAVADEKSYNPDRNSSMGADHPMVWTSCVGKGRMFYSAIGHNGENYAEPVYVKMLENALVWASGKGGPGCPAK
jgi:type 1 glutamine amidotransferase